MANQVTKAFMVEVVTIALLDGPNANGLTFNEAKAHAERIVDTVVRFNLVQLKHGTSPKTDTLQSK
jgi:hypothetical protein